MNDNMSNTPDNASRPGKAPHPSNEKSRPRPRDEHGRFLPVASDSVEEARNMPLAGARGEITVGEFMDAADKFHGGDILSALAREHKPNRIGKHVDVTNKETPSHTRRVKNRRTKDVVNQPPVTDNRRTMLYQIRTLPGNRGYGLYYADGVEYNDPARGSKDIVKHWLGENWYQAFDAGAARVFTTPDEARKFRREHYTLGVDVDDTSVKMKREARQERARTWRRFARGKHQSHTTSKKFSVIEKRTSPKVREDLVKLYKLIGRTH